MERRSDVSESVPSPRDAEAVAEFLASLPHDPEARQNLNRYLGYYESLAVGANMGIVDREVLNRAWGRSILGVYFAYRDHIEKRRLESGLPSLYRELEDLCSWLTAHRSAAVVATRNTRTGDVSTTHLGDAAAPMARAQSGR